MHIALGDLAGVDLTTGGGNIDIGNRGFAGESNTIRIGTQAGQAATFIAGVYNGSIDPMSATPVYVDANGELGTVPSSQRFKRDVKAIGETSQSILALKPVSFHYRTTRETRQNLA